MRRILLGLVFVLNAGCGQAEMTPEASPTASKPPAPSSTFTPRPSATITITSTPTYTPNPTRTPFPIPPPENHYGGFSFSPNGEWAAWPVCCSNGYYLLVENIFNDKEWGGYSEYLKPSIEGHIEAILWSKDGRYLFYGATPPGDGGHFRVFADLYRLALEDGSITTVLGAGNIYTVSFTQDETKLAYIPWYYSPSHVVILNMVNGNENHISIPKYKTFWAGGMNWSPDNSKLIFAVLNFDAMNELQYEPYNIILVDVSSRRSHIIIENYNGTLCPLEWIDETHVVTGKWCWSDPNDTGLILNIETGELTAIEE